MNGVNVIVGDVLIGLGAALVVLGLVGVFRFKNFYLKLLAGSKIDTVAVLAIGLGVVVRSGITWFSAKALFALAILLVVNPIVTGVLASGKRRSDVAAGAAGAAGAAVTGGPAAGATAVENVEEA